MRNLESSPHLENPGLVEIKSASISGGLRANDFLMNVNITRAKVEAPAPAAKKPGAKG
jgi:type IV pilus assembly protein PilN